MTDALKAEVDRNYDYFQRNLAQFMTKHGGQYALLKSSKAIGFYNGPGEAYRAGLVLYPNEIFSVQEVTDIPVDLGFMSLAFA